MFEGIDWVRLKEFQIFRGGTHKEIEIRKAEDIFASLEERDRTIPNGGRLSKASFQIKFSDSKTPEPSHSAPGTGLSSNGMMTPRFLKSG